MPLQTIPNVKNFLTLFILSLALSARAQVAGDFDDLVPNDSLYNAIESVGELYGADKDGAVAKRISLRAYFPLNIFPASGGFSWTAAVSKAMSMQLGIDRKWAREKIEKEILSPYYLYDQLPKASPAGCQLRKDWILATKNVLLTTGHVRSIDYKHSTIDCRRKPSAELVGSMDRVQARAFIKLFANDTTNKNMKVGEKKFKILRSLQRSRPVIICLETDQQFIHLKTENWTPSYKTKPVFQTAVIVGYDDAKNAFEIAHPSGKNWGKNGFAWMRYSDVYLIKNAVEIVLQERPVLAKKAKTQSSIPKTRTAPVPKPTDLRASEAFSATVLRGEMVINTVDRQGHYVAIPAVSNVKGYYQLAERYGVDAQFQLVGTGTTPNSFVYVIGVDPKGNAELHYPYKRRYAASADAGSPLVADPTSEIVIPEPEISYDENGFQNRKEQVFAKEYAGADWLLTLYSDQPIDSEVAALVKNLSGHNADFMTRFNAVFGKYLIPKNQVVFDKHRIGFKTVALSESYVVPVIVKIEGN